MKWTIEIFAQATVVVEVVRVAISKVQELCRLRILVFALQISTFSSLSDEGLVVKSIVRFANLQDKRTPFQSVFKVGYSQTKNWGPENHPHPPLTFSGHVDHVTYSFRMPSSSIQGFNFTFCVRKRGDLVGRLR